MMFARRTQGQVHYTFNKQQCHVKNIYTVEEKQKYHITFFCEKNKNIILHHVLPNSPENIFLLPLSFLWKNHLILLREKESKL